MNDQERWFKRQVCENTMQIDELKKAISLINTRIDTLDVRETYFNIAKYKADLRDAVSILKARIDSFSL